MTSCGPMSASMRVAGTPSVRYDIIRILGNGISSLRIFLQACTTTYPFRSATWFGMSAFTRERNPTTVSCAKNISHQGQTWNSTCKCTATRYFPLLICVYLKLSRMQYQCFVAGCDKQYLYMSSLKKHLVISHPKEYAAKVKTRQSKCWEGFILSSSSKRLQGMGHYNLGATTADEGGQTRWGAWNWLPQKLSGAILWDIPFHWWRVRRPWWWRAPSVEKGGIIKRHGFSLFQPPT